MFIEFAIVKKTNNKCGHTVLMFSEIVVVYKAVNLVHALFSFLLTNRYCLANQVSMLLSTFADVLV